MSSIKFLLFSFFFASIAFAYGQKIKTLPPDSSQVDIRSFDQAKLEKLKADPELDYGRSPAAINLWEIGRAHV